MNEPMNQSISHIGSGVEVNKVLKNTYLLLGMTLLFSALTAGVSMAIGLPHMAALGCFIAAFAMLFFMNKVVNSSMGLVFAFAFTGLLGAALGPTISHYLALPNGHGMVMQALGGTAVVFFALSAVSIFTKKDFSFMSRFLMVGLIVAIVAMIANIFLQMPTLRLVTSSMIVLLMSGYILYDTSRIVRGGETNYIRATISLFLNIYNLFTSLLHLVGVFDE